MTDYTFPVQASLGRQNLAIFRGPDERAATVTGYIGDDGALVLHIDTTDTTGHLRVNLNDGPPVWDGDPGEGVIRPEMNVGDADNWFTSDGASGWTITRPESAR